MNNPFASIDARLTNIESLLLDLKHQPLKPQEPQTPAHLLTRREVADRLQISLISVDKYAKQGILKSYRIGGAIRFKSGEVDKALEEVRNAKHRRA